ncbi:hypothetical protein [Streptomyces werraensis]|uniref:hypothetical protein n=1 Tax=Streptomyces werraensis TaxID=68284 RepID=UPI003F4DFA12
MSPPSPPARSPSDVTGAVAAPFKRRPGRPRSLPPKTGPSNASNAETVARLRDNGRITLMWCAFQGPPNIVRVHGRGEPVFRDDPRFKELLAHFPGIDPWSHGLRAVVVVRADLIRDTCGYAVPYMAYEGERDLHERPFAREDDASLDAYFTKKEHVATSLDGLPGLPLPLPPSSM